MCHSSHLPLGNVSLFSPATRECVPVQCPVQVGLGTVGPEDGPDGLHSNTTVDERRERLATVHEGVHKHTGKMQQAMDAGNVEPFLEKPHKTDPSPTPARPLAQA
jgi:hypothetical protein